MKNIRSFTSRPRAAHLGLLVTLTGSLVLAVPLGAQFTIKENNADTLNLETSWVDGLLPDDATTAVWDATVTGGSSVSLGADAFWNGIQILDPGGSVSISGNVLTTGFAGIDLSEATQDATISSGINFAAPQKIQAGPGRILELSGELTQSAGAGLDFRIDPTGDVLITGGWVDFIQSAGSQISATYNGMDYAAASYDNSPRNVIPGLEDEFLTGEYYTPNPPANPEDPEGLPALIGGGDYTFLMDFVDDSAPGATTGGADAGNTGVSNIRFNQPNNNFDGWLVTQSDEGHTITVASILVTENVGAQDVQVGSQGWTRIDPGAGSLLVFQYNTGGDLILGGRSISEKNGSSLSKLGEGRLIVDAPTAYTGPTYVQGGTLQFRQAVVSGNLVDVASGATLDLDGADLTISSMNVRQGALLTGFGRVTGGVTNHGDMLVVGTGKRLLLTGDVVNHGTILVQDGGYLEIDGTFANYGTLDYSTAYATLPEGYTNEGTVVEGENGAPPSPVEDTRVSQFFNDQGVLQVLVPSLEGFNYQLERSFTLRSPVLELTQVSTADGNGADTFLGNDGQGGYGPDVNHGDWDNIQVRNYDTVRMKMGLARLDISGLSEGYVMDEAVFSIHTLGSNRTRTFELWGVTDESLDEWIESGEGGVTYNSFDGFLDAPLGSKLVNEDAMILLGTFQVAAAGATFSTDPATVPLGDFLRADTNGMVSFVFFMTGTDSNASYSFAPKENISIGSVNALTGDTVIAPTLTIPSEAYVLERETLDPWIPVGAAQSGNGEVLTLTDDMPEVDRAFYRVLIEQ